MINTHSLIIVVIIALITMFLRVIPFVVFSKKKTPDFIVYLGKLLPYSIMGMLVVYCLRNVSLISSPHGIPEILACLTVVIVHIWRRNTLLSILGGTIVYMVLVQAVF